MAASLKLSLGSPLAAVRSACSDRDMSLEMGPNAHLAAEILPAIDSSSLHEQSFLVARALRSWSRRAF